MQANQPQVKHHRKAAAVMVDRYCSIEFGKYKYKVSCKYACTHATHPLRLKIANIPIVARTEQPIKYRDLKKNRQSITLAYGLIDLNEKKNTIHDYQGAQSSNSRC